MPDPHLNIAPLVLVDERTPPAVNSRRQTMAVLRVGSRTLLPAVDTVVLCDAWEAPPVQGHIPFADLVRVLEGGVSWVDDAHLLVEAVGPDRWATLVRAARPPAKVSPPVGPVPTEFATTGWVWLVDQGVRYLAFEFDDPGRGRSARGRAVSDPPTVAEVQAAVEQPDHTFPTGAGVGEVRGLGIEEVRALGLPPAPPWA